MRVLIAFDKFKDAITAGEACEVAARTLRRIRPDWQLDLCPLTDGGDGFEEVIGTAVGAQRIQIEVTGPRDAAVNAGFSVSRLDRFSPQARQELLTVADLSAQAPIAIIEMARASGLALLRPEHRDPWQTTTLGTGQLIRAAAAQGVEAMILGIGGSATNDLGLGALNALGFVYLDANGEKISPGTPQQWHKIEKLEQADCPPLPPLLIASDVINPLLGPSGAAAVYGPQKGLDPASLNTLESASTRIAQLLCAQRRKPWSLTEMPGAGAAGGIAFGLLCAVNAHLRPGFTLTSACLDLKRRLQAADLIITGEGRFDQTSTKGKGPGALVESALVTGKPIHVFAGRISAERRINLSLEEISGKDLSDQEMLDRTAENLSRAIERVFYHL